MTGATHAAVPMLFMQEGESGDKGGTLFIIFILIAVFILALAVNLIRGAIKGRSADDSLREALEFIPYIIVGFMVAVLMLVVVVFMPLVISIILVWIATGDFCLLPDMLKYHWDVLAITVMIFDTAFGAGMLFFIDRRYILEDRNSGKRTPIVANPKSE